MENVLELENLRIAFPGPYGVIRAVEGINLTVGEGECLALVGESGCGKSVTSLAAMRLLDPASAVVRADKHLLCGQDVSKLTKRQMEKLRGGIAAMIFQDALSALNPVMTIGKQIDEILLLHRKISRREARTRTIELLSMVGIPEPEVRYRSFPHELSGGMRQRVLIAMAFACEPKLIIADEPTTALDVTIQAQVLEILQRMQRQRNTALLLISHDLSVVVHMADRIAVMYSGKLVEQATAAELFRNPLHPYTRGLMASAVQMGDAGDEFSQIPGTLPDPADKPAGCYFCPRCGQRTGRCAEKMPPMREVRPGHFVRCFLWNGGENDF